MSQKDRLKRYLNFIRTEDEIYEIEERLAIMQYDGGMTEFDAIKKYLDMRYKEKYFPNYNLYRTD